MNATSGVDRWRAIAAHLMITMVSLAMLASCSNIDPVAATTSLAPLSVPGVTAVQPTSITAAVTTAAPTRTAPTATTPATTPSTSPPSTSTPSTTTPSTSTTAPPPTTPPETTIPLVTAGATVLVANATGASGAAAKFSKQLSKLGFVMATPTNAAGLEERLDTTKVYFLADGEAVAQSLATLLGVAATRMPVPVSINGGPAALGEATVVVMLGKDLAGKSVPG